MIVNDEKENKNQALPIRDRKCMVQGGGNIPTSDQLLIGMEHDKPTGMFGSGFQDSPNGISDLLDVDMMDDDAEIEAAAAQSELSMPVMLNPSPPQPSQPPQPPQQPQRSSYKPLHVQINPYGGSSGEPSSSSGPRTANEASISHPYYPPPPTNKNRPPHSNPPGRKPKDYNNTIRTGPAAGMSAASIVMGPPGVTSSVMLSPAGNLRTGDSAPQSPAGLSRTAQRRDSTAFAHPLAMSSSGVASSSKGPNPTAPANRLSSIAATIGLVSSGGGSTPTIGPPISSQAARRELENNRKRAISDKINNYRAEAKITPFLPSMETLSDLQIVGFTRKTKAESSKELPVAIRNEYFDEKIEDLGPMMVAKKLRDAEVLRFRDTLIDDVTDVSEDEEDMSAALRARKKDLVPTKVRPERFEWNQHKMRCGGVMTATNALLDERLDVYNMLENQMEDLNKSSGARFINEEAQPRKRRIVDGRIQLMVSVPFERQGTEEFGCARCRPLKSWTRRPLIKDVFGDKRSSSIFDPSQPGCSMNFDSLPKYDHKKIAVGSQPVVTIMTDGEKRETMEYEYFAYEEGKGMVEAPSLLDNLSRKNFPNVESRLLSHFYRLAVAPKMVTRTNLDRSTLLDNGADERLRNGAVRLVTKKEKPERKRERRQVQEVSSDEEDSKNESPIKAKRGRGRPVKNIKKAPAPAPAPVRQSARTAARVFKPDYGIDDYLMEDNSAIIMPEKIEYAKIFVPKFDLIPDDFWDSENFSEPPSEDNEELWTYVAKEHHKLAHIEKQWFKKATERNPRRDKIKREDSTEDDDGLHNLPPFDLDEYIESRKVHATRRYASVEEPYKKRDFSLKSKSPKTPSPQASSSSQEQESVPSS